MRAPKRTDQDLFDQVVALQKLLNEAKELLRWYKDCRSLGCFHDSPCAKCKRRNEIVGDHVA